MTVIATAAKKFSALKPGDCFELYGQAYLKIGSLPGDPYNAVRIHDGEPTEMGSGDDVIPLSEAKFLTHG